MGKTKDADRDFSQPCQEDEAPDSKPQARSDFCAVSTDVCIKQRSCELGSSEMALTVPIPLNTSHVQSGASG